jgi:hypothetical protein
MPDELNHQAVKHLAYKLWRDRGSPLGSPDEDWFRAEAELNGQSASEYPLSFLVTSPAEE